MSVNGPSPTYWDVRDLVVIKGESGPRAADLLQEYEAKVVADFDPYATWAFMDFCSAN